MAAWLIQRLRSPTSSASVVVGCTCLKAAGDPAGVHGYGAFGHGDASFWLGVGLFKPQRFCPSGALATIGFGASGVSLVLVDLSALRVLNDWRRRLRLLWRLHRLWS